MVGALRFSAATPTIHTHSSTKTETVTPAATNATFGLALRTGATAASSTCTADVSRRSSKRACSYIGRTYSMILAWRMISCRACAYCRPTCGNSRSGTGRSADPPLDSDSSCARAVSYATRAATVCGFSSPNSDWSARYCTSA